MRRRVAELPLHRGRAPGGKGAASRAAPSRRDPAERKWADYSYAHGGKVGTPHPVDRAAYDRSVEVLHDAVRRARLGDRKKSEALKRLARWTSRWEEER